MVEANLGMFSAYANSARCHGDAVCERVHRYQPSLPIAPPWDPALNNPCLRGSGEGTSGPPSCIPHAHVLGGWHCFVEERLSPLLKGHPLVQLNDKLGATCFNEWDDAKQAKAKWFGGWKVRTKSERRLVQQCIHSLSFYPAYPVGYLREFLKAYWPCKSAQVEALRASGKPEGHYYGGLMWSKCRPEALAAHDAATGTGGVGHEMTPPFVMKAVYGPRRPRLVALVRDPIDRLETSFWVHPHCRRRGARTRDGREVRVIR